VIVLIPVSGQEDEHFFRRAAELLPLPRVESVLLAHVVDAGARGDVELGRDRYLLHRPLPKHRVRELSEAEGGRARDALACARQALTAAGVPDTLLHEVILHGKPREALRDLAVQQGALMTVVSARPGKPGPHSLGKTARFLTDHVSGAVLLIRP
jgi:nucleotide-binding universal stress UspA family protein